jgi:hypothetical protein
VVALGILLFIFEFCMIGVCKVGAFEGNESPVETMVLSAVKPQGLLHFEGLIMRDICKDPSTQRMHVRYMASEGF